MNEFECDLFGQKKKKKVIQLIALFLFAISLNPVFECSFTRNNLI